MSSAPAAKVDASLNAGVGVVILHGEDRFLVRQHSRDLIEALTGAHGEIEQFTFDGDTVEPAVVLDELRSFGLLQRHKIVIVEQADKMLASKDEKAGKAGKAAGPRRKTARELFEKYAEAPVDSATLLLRAETWRPGRLDNAVKKSGGVVLKCSAPDQRTAAGWCVDHCHRAYGGRISREAAVVLVDRIGTNRARLDVELGKLSAYAGPDGDIDAAAIRDLVGLSREEKAWSIQSALVSGSIPLAVEKLRELMTVSRQPEPLIFWAITDLLKKLHAASRLLAAGASPEAVARELKLWGDARDAVLSTARRVDPDQLAQLLQDAIDADRGTKSALGTAPRTLEALTVRIADTVGI